MNILGTLGWWSKAKFSKWSPVQTLLQYQRFFCQTICPGYNQNIVCPKKFYFVDSIQIKHRRTIGQKPTLFGGKIMGYIYAIWIKCQGSPYGLGTFQRVLPFGEIMMLS